MLKAPPVFSSITAMVAPKIIMNEMEAMVLPNPVFIVANILSKGIVSSARIKETINNEAKAFTFNLEVRTIIANIAAAT
jgi:hypothetical protein